MNKGKRIASYAGVAVGILVAALVQQYFFAAPSFDKKMVKVASNLNKTCPIMLDKETRLDNTVALPGHVFQYNFTLVHMTKGSVDVQALKKYIEPNALNNIKTNPDLKVFRDNKTTMNYFYRDKNGTFLLKISITPDQYEE